MKVLLAADGSIESDLAEAALTRLPIAGAEIVVAMVVASPVMAFMPPGLPYDFDDGGLSRLQNEVAERTTQHICDRLRGKGLKATPRVVQGDVASKLLELDEEEGFDLIAAGSRIESNIRAAFLGSVSRKLTLHAKSSVLVGHHFRQKPTDGSIDRLASKDRLDVLIAVDGTPGGDMAVRALEACPRSSFGKLIVLTVGSKPADEAECLSTAGSVAARLKHAAAIVEPAFAIGRPSTAIVKDAASRDVDLVMLGANRHGAVERMIVGSCAYETVTSAPCSVLVVRGVLPLS